jgi:hypothetical protein
VRNTDGSVRLPALDTHAMGTIFEELIRRFNEENNEEAGEHFTPRDVVRLVADLIFLPIADQIESGAYLIYDGACGTGGMLTVAEARLAELAHEHGKEVSIHLFGQEVNPETYSITKADLLLEEGGSEAFVRREVLPHVPDAWIDADTTKIGYEISFTRYFYRAQPLRTLEEIRADLEALQKESEGLLEHILLEG